MVDVAKLLETLHPMREPPAPASILPYVVLLAVGCASAIAALAMVGWLRHRRAALRSSVEASLAASRGLDPPDRLAAQAGVLRRLARSLASEDASRAQGDAWLAHLDQVFDTRFFTQGAGKAFGASLYARPRDIDLDALERSLLGLVAKVRLP